MVQDRAEGVHIRCGGERVAPDLLGTRVVPGHERRLGRRDQSFAAIVAEEPRNAEVEQLDPSIPGDQNVAGLEVSMNHQVAMGVADRIADLEKKADPGPDIQRAPIAVAIDRLSLHVLHHQIGAQLSDPAIEQPGNVAMVQPGQDLPFPPEAVHRFGRKRPRSDQLHRDPMLEFPIVSLAQIHGAHPAFAQEPGQAMRPDPMAHRGSSAAGEGFQNRRWKRFEKGALVASGGQKSLERLAKVHIVVADRFEKSRQLVRTHLERTIEQGPDSMPEVGGKSHGAESVRARRSQARAACQSRFTVAGDNWSAAAVSATSSPPK